MPLTSMEAVLRDACDSCHQRKVRCRSLDGQTCVSCRKAGVQCAFSPRSVMGRPRARRQGERVGQMKMRGEAPSDALEWTNAVQSSQWATYPIEFDVTANVQGLPDEAGLIGDNASTGLSKRSLPGRPDSLDIYLAGRESTDNSRTESLSSPECVNPAIEVLQDRTCDTFVAHSDGHIEHLSVILFELHRIQYLLPDVEDGPGCFEQVSSDEVLGLVTRGCDLLQWSLTAIATPSSHTTPYTALVFVLVSTVIDIYGRLWKLEEPNLIVHPVVPGLASPVEMSSYHLFSNTDRRVKSYSAAATMVCHLQILETALNWASTACSGSRQAQRTLVGLRRDICQSVGMV